MYLTDIQDIGPGDSGHIDFSKASSSNASGVFKHVFGFFLIALRPLTWKKRKPTQKNPDAAGKTREALQLEAFEESRRPEPPGRAALSPTTHLTDI